MRNCNVEYNSTLRFGLVFCLFFTLLPCFGSNDSIRVESLRRFDKNKIEAIKADPDFSYVQESKVTHWWDDIKAWIVKKLSELFEDFDRFLEFDL